MYPVNDTKFKVDILFVFDNVVVSIVYVLLVPTECYRKREAISLYLPNF